MTKTLIKLLVATSLLTACAPLITGSTDPQAVSEIMQSTNARGCLYHTNHTEQFLRSDTVIIGVWGTPSPQLSECIPGLPRLLP